MDKRIVIVGAGLAGLATVNTLLQNNINNITLLYQGTNPWNRDEFDGFGGDIWQQQTIFDKKAKVLPLSQILSLDTLNNKIPQLCDFITKYTTEGYTETEEAFELTETQSTRLLQRLWTIFTREGVNLVDQASCRPITNTLNYIIYDREGEKEEQQFDRLVIAPGQLGYGIIHSLAEYYNEIQPQDVKTTSNISITQNFQIHDNVYVVGGVLGYKCPTSSIIQGIIAAESILNSL